MPNGLIFGMFLCVGLILHLIGSIWVHTENKESGKYVFGVLLDGLAKVLLVTSGVAFYFLLLKP